MEVVKSPLHNKRLEIFELLKKLPVQTGDIFFRASNAKGPFGIPFSRIVSLLTNSDYSHASIAIDFKSEQFLLEINDKGTQLSRIVDWLDLCHTGKFSIYRYKEMTPEVRKKVRDAILDFLKDDPEYDFTFQSENNFYCTESVVHIYEQADITLTEGETVKEAVPFWVYACLYIANFVVSRLSHCSIPFDGKMYYVGNKERGMMSSDKLQSILEYPIENQETN